jgi:predicted flap endonuclease-1-like 5' DNA nuclease
LLAPRAGDFSLNFIEVIRFRRGPLEDQGEKLKNPVADSGEDLKVVKGIGPKFEKLLKAEGIVNVRQIADWTEADAEVVAKKIGVKLERIRREDWIGSAKRRLESA